MNREVQLNPSHAEAYPSLSPGRWYTAAAIAGLVKATRIIREGVGIAIPDRLLPTEAFTFRGGAPRSGNWLAMRTRRIDRHPSGRPLQGE
jgi:hypothetical protein